MEIELVISFLLSKKRHRDEKPDVLPIVGPGRVGKSTLVAHVCRDERIRDCFSEVVFLTDHDFRDETTRFTSNGTKIIITSRSDKITELGTTGVVTQAYLSIEAYWYFFRTHLEAQIPRSTQGMLLLSMVLGKAIGRSIDFLISKCSQSSSHQEQDVEGILCSVLLRAQLIIQEAMERQVTNQAMLRQLDMLRGAMHRGSYMLDAFRYQRLHDKEYAEAEGQFIMSQSLSLCKVNSSKRFCPADRQKTQDSEQQLQEVLESLSSMILDANEMVIFLRSYPRMYRQPYSMHLLLANCMFDREMETQLVINFLLRTNPHRAEELEVLPIVGPGRVGKRTLVAHVCNDERIRDHFSGIVFLTDNDLIDEMLSVLTQGCASMEQQHNDNTRKDGRLLVILKADGDVTEDAWNRLCSALRRCTTNGTTKIIITSRSDGVRKLGTTGFVSLKYPSSEAYWYFFKTLAFGSTDPEQHPRLASVAMEIARMINNTTLVGANIITSLLRDNFDINFWCKVLAFVRRLIQNHIAKFGEHPCDLLNQNRPTCLGGRMMGRASEDLMVYDVYQCSSKEAVPNITIHDVLYGSLKPPGKFEVLAWRSRILPYYNYIYTCQIEDKKAKAVKRKRSQSNG
ncbi:putative disease resistance protein RGA3 [Panicum virgatum]|uniref:putative disease resistance protein RGA3 n=1 Tax=Panicum virgatum TaxID=38727 RepID=UPI0019D6135F|nr:putative disease resistance protein RGA3 [Panicum virgatum]